MGAGMNLIRRSILTLISICLFSSTIFFSSAALAEDLTIRIGYFPNITHAHALIAQNMAEQDEGWFEQRIPGLNIEWVSFNAGPSAMEALFAGTVDFTYVGPNPALNAYIRSEGDDVRVLSGAVRGGAALVAPKNSTYKTPQDFIGKRIATPQLGNTQDIACRNWFSSAGMLVTMTGGDVTIVPTPNASMYSLFITNEIDAAWTVEPWVSRLELEAEGKIIYSEPPEQSLTTILVCSKDFLQEHPDIVEKITDANIKLNEWILANTEKAQKHVGDELTRQTKREFPLSLVEHAWPRLVFNTNISVEDFTLSMNAARAVGFLDKNFDINGLVVK